MGAALLGLNRMLHDPIGKGIKKAGDLKDSLIDKFSPTSSSTKDKAQNNGYDHHSDKTSSSSSTHINSSSNIKNYTEDYTNSKAKFDTESKNMDILQKEKSMLDDDIKDLEEQRKNTHSFSDKEKLDKQIARKELQKEKLDVRIETSGNKLDGYLNEMDAKKTTHGGRGWKSKLALTMGALFGGEAAMKNGTLVNSQGKPFVTPQQIQQQPLKTTHQAITANTNAIINTMNGQTAK